MVVRKLNYYRVFCFIAIVIAIIVFSVKFINKKQYEKTYEYKFTQKGYSLEEINTLQKELTETQLNEILNKEYNEYLTGFLSEKYFLYKNLDAYLEYKKEHKKEENKKIVSIINTEANIDWFDGTKETDLSKKELMLVNRLYGLKSDYEPSDIIDVPSKYAYSGKKISNSILQPMIDMFTAASEQGYKIVVTDGYRTYKEQEKIYDSYVDSYGMSETDKLVARPGHSEYQTGLSFDVAPYNKVLDNPKETEEYKWLRENAHKYGFIFRFDEDKKYLTQFNASTWRLRYVGKDAATIIKNENICYEEYYAYFVDKEK